MATKYEIKEFLKRKKGEAVSKVNSDYENKKYQIKQDFLSKFSDAISAVRSDLEAASDNFDILRIETEKAGIKFQDKYYSSPMYYIDQAFEKASGSEITNYFTMPGLEKLKQLKDQAIEETGNEYTRLIAVTQSMNAKDGLALLKNLGFDTTDLEAVKPVTALTINIDRNKLFI